MFQKFEQSHIKHKIVQNSISRFWYSVILISLTLYETADPENDER